MLCLCVCVSHFVFVVIVVWVSVVKPAFRTPCATEFAIESWLLLVFLLVIAVLIVNIFTLIKLCYPKLFIFMFSFAISKHKHESLLLDIKRLTQKLMSYLFFK